MKSIKEIFSKKYHLSPRECEVAELVIQGLQNKAIADRLFICLKTVKFHTCNIYKKTPAKSRSELIVLAIREMAPGIAADHFNGAYA